MDTTNALLKDKGFGWMDMCEKDFSNSVLINCDFSDSSLCEIDFTNTWIVDSNFTNAFIVNTRFEHAKIIYSKFDYARLAYSRFHNVIIKNMAMNEVYMTHTDFVQCTISDSSISGASTSKMGFADTIMKDVNMNVAVLDNPRMSPLLN